MKSSYFFVFFLIVIAIYAAAHFYLYVRAMQVFTFTTPVKRWISVGYCIFVSLFIFGMMLQRSHPSLFSEWIYKIGTAWLPFILYFLIILLCIDLVRIANHFFHFIPTFSSHAKIILGLIIIFIVSGIVLIGHINAKNIRIQHLSLNINKKVEGKKDIRIVLASDLHLGAIIGEKWEKKFVKMVEHENPDLVLLCGDIIDGEISPVIRQNLGKHIQEIHPPLGLYATTGNHEYIGNIDKALNYLHGINITVLNDEVITLSNGIQLIGRKDSQSKYAGDNPSLPLDSLLHSIDCSKPIIVMKHQPTDLDEASRAKVDLHLSGHTHGGQLFPINFITQAMFEISWGYKKKENTHCYVSSGFGSWGPSVRLGNVPEIVVFDVHFQ